MTEHSAVIFVFFFLAEYASIIIINIFSTILFFGGYLMDISLVTEILRYINIDSYYYIMITDIKDSWASLMYTVLGEGFINGIIIGIKSCILVFVFIWVRASFPRIRYDQLMSFCWTILLPQIVGFIILYPCIFSTFSIFSVIWL